MMMNNDMWWRWRKPVAKEIKKFCAGKKDDKKSSILNADLIKINLDERRYE
jgi:hypothetical protein